MDFDRPVLLYGAGREAKSTRAFLAGRAPELPVFVCVDDGAADIPGTTQIAVSELPAFVAGRRLGTIVKSPGVSLYKPIFAEAKAAGIAVTSNLNLWGKFFRQGKVVIAISGTKGKSTTATLTHAMLRAGGLDAGLAGNVGLPPLDMDDRHKTVVFELSSYQTADLDFAPDFAALTTLYPEHIDWHGSTERYYADKLRLLTMADSTRLAIGTQAASLPLVQSSIGDARRTIPVLSSTLEDEIFDAGISARLKGQHNIDNAFLAARLAVALGVDDDAVIQAVKEFTPLPHRLEEHKIGGKLFVDDSISTTPEATKAALAAYFGHKIALIAGGFDRQQDYVELANLMARQGVNLVVCLPDTGTRLAQAVRTHHPGATVLEASTLEGAMGQLHTRMSQFDTLILSPGAPSYNHFRNFEERGAAFVALAGKLFA